MKTLIKRTQERETEIRARIPDENHNAADSEELMIDAVGEGPAVLENDSVAILSCPLFCATYV